MKQGSFSSLPIEQWPEQDQTLWAAARKDGGYWDDTGLAAHWRRATIVNAEYHYGTFLWWLERSGRLDIKAAPVNRATAENIASFAEVYAASHAQASVAAVVRVVADMVRATTPLADVQWVYALANRIKRTAKPAKPPSHRMRPAMELVDVANSLIERGERLLEERPYFGASHFRNGLMILAETSLPLRRNNYAGLRLGDTLHREQNRYRVMIPASDMKNRRDFEGWYPDWLTEKFDFYLEQARPALRARQKGPDEGDVLSLGL